MIDVPDEIAVLCNTVLASAEGNREASDRLGPALSALTAAVQTQGIRRGVCERLGDAGSVEAALRSENPKVRKNAARLLGRIGTERNVPGLRDALLREGTRFVVPSLLLALGAIGSDAAKKTVSAYEVPVPVSPEEEKHCREIREAKDKAMNRLFPAETETIHTFRRPVLALATAPMGFIPALREELTQLGLEPTEVKSGCRIRTEDADTALKARCMNELLIPCGRAALSGASVSEAAKLGWSALCEETESGAPALPYRVELRNYPGDRALFIREIANAVGGVDSPGSYAFEIRVVVTGADAMVLVKPCKVRDRRFAYRKRVLPASIRPETAACMVRHALTLCPELNSGKRVKVYDPCCGSGTLLIEAKRLLPHAELTGTDVDPEAVAAAQENMQAACSGGFVLRKDCLKFAAKEPYDLILCNLPFGNRVGNHAKNEALYQGLCKRLPELLAAGGMAVLYTTEGKLLERCMKNSGSFQLKDLLRTDAGGLTPTVYYVNNL